MPIYLAIDAGGTKTRCLLADDDRVLARAATGTVKLMRVSEAEATARLNAMLDEVAASAGVSLQQVERTCFGLAGLSIPAVRAWATAALGAKVAGSLVLCGDEEIALDAAFHGEPGILVVAGTGSNAIGRARDGRIQSAGGWGPVLGDEGSGYWIGLEAIRAALSAHDAERGVAAMGSTPATALLVEIQRFWGLGSLAELIQLGNHRGDATRPAPDFAALVPIVARCAEQGNAIAVRVLRRAGERLAGLVVQVAGKLGEDSASSASSVAVAFTGSVLTEIAVVRESMVGSVASLAPVARVRESPVDPLEGALWRARQTAY